MEIKFEPALLGFVPAKDYPPQLTESLDYLIHNGERFVRRVDIEKAQAERPKH